MENEKKDLTGMEAAAANVAECRGTSMKDVEYDLTAALLKTAEFRNSAEGSEEIKIYRGGEFAFSFRIRPLSDKETQTARRKATPMLKNPQGAKYPKIEGKTNTEEFHSYLIFFATIEEDRNKIWRNQALKDKYDILNDIETIDLLLAFGEKMDVVNKILDISGLEEEDEATPEEYAKN